MSVDAKGKAYGFGYFGQWIEDQFGLRTLHYSCDQINDPQSRYPGKSRTSLFHGAHSSSWQRSHCRDRLQLRTCTRAPG